MSTPREDFLFLGHGGLPARATTLWVALANPAASAEALREALEVMGPIREWRDDGPVAELKVRPSSPAHRDEVLRTVHAREPLGLVVQVSGGGDSDWHRASAANVGAVLEALERVVAAPGAPYAERWQLRGGWRSLDVHTLLLKQVHGDRPRMLVAALKAVERAASKRSRAVMVDLFLERLPGWVGRNFEVDLVLRHTLARLQQVSPTSVEMPQAFHEALAARFGGGRPSEPAGALDLADSGALSRAVDAGDWRAVRSAWRDGDGGQHAALLALDDARLAQLAKHGFGTHLASAGAFRLTAADFAGALKLFDAAMHGELDPRACANPLYAVQDDNHHLGVMPERARRYLAVCLPFGPQNPTIFLNGAFVCMELNEPERALELLRQAKAAGVAIKAHRNERLFAPLRTRLKFAALMK